MYVGTRHAMLRGDATASCLCICLWH